MMECMHETIRRHRGLMMIIAILTAAFVLEPSIRSTGNTCLDLIIKISEWRAE